MLPDWSQSEDTVSAELQSVIKNVLIHPNKEQIKLIIDTNNISDENADLILGGIFMNLLTQADLNVEDADISITGSLDEIQWKSLLSKMDSRIVLENENWEVIKRYGVENMPVLEMNV